MKKLTYAALRVVVVFVLCANNLFAEVLFDYTRRDTNNTMLIPNLGAQYGVMTILPPVDIKGGKPYKGLCRPKRWTQVFRFASEEDMRSSSFTVIFYPNLQSFYTQTNHLWSQEISGQELSYSLVGSDQGGPLLKVSSPLSVINLDVSSIFHLVIAVKVKEIHSATRVHYVLWHSSGNSHAAGRVSGFDVTGPIGPPYLACAIEADIFVRDAEVTPPLLHYDGNAITWQENIPGSYFEEAEFVHGPWRVVKEFGGSSAPIIILRPEVNNSARFYRLGY